MAPDLFALVPSVAQAEFGHLDCMQLALQTTIVHHCGYRRLMTSDPCWPKEVAKHVRPSAVPHQMHSRDMQRSTQRCRDQRTLAEIQGDAVAKFRETFITQEATRLQRCVLCSSKISVLI